MGAEKFAPSLVTMVAAGGDMADVLELAKTQGVRAVHVEQLAVPVEEHGSRLRLIAAMKSELPHIHRAQYHAYPTSEFVWCVHGVPKVECAECQKAKQEMK